MKSIRVIRTVSYFVFGLIGLLIISNLSVNYFIDKKLTPLVKDKFFKASGFKYVLSFDKLSINVFTKNISVGHVAISPFNKIKASTMQFKVKAKSFEVNGFSILAYFSDKKIVIGTIKILEPEVSFYINDSVKSEKLIINNKISNLIHSISIQQIDIVNCHLNAYSSLNDSLPFLKSNNNAFSIKNTFFSFEEAQSKNRFKVKDVDFVLNEVEYYLPDKLYTLRGKKIYVSFSKSLLVIDSLKLTPNYSKKEFADKVKFQASRIELVTSKIKIKDIDYNRLYKEYNINAKKIEMADCLLNVYRDNTKSLKHENKPSLQALIKSIPILFSIDTIEIKNGRINFEALQPLASSTGKIFIDKVYLKVFNVFNDTLNMNDTNCIKADFGGYVLGKAKFIESYVFPMNCKGESFSCSGSISAIPLSAFNSIVKPAKHILFREGHLDNVVFSFEAKEKISSGSMTFKYHGLKIDVLSNRNTKGGIKSFIGTFVLNNFKINKSNPGADGKTRKVKLFVKNNPYRYFLFYSMQTILSGIEPTILKNKE